MVDRLREYPRLYELAQLKAQHAATHAAAHPPLTVAAPDLIPPAGAAAVATAAAAGAGAPGFDLARRLGSRVLYVVLVDAPTDPAAAAAGVRAWCGWNELAALRVEDIAAVPGSCSCERATATNWSAGGSYLRGGGIVERRYTVVERDITWVKTNRRRAAVAAEAAASGQLSAREAADPLMAVGDVYYADH
ncbi:hypothetical protein HK405_010899, partial [Cladochytrium tenue]